MGEKKLRVTISLDEDFYWRAAKILADEKVEVAAWMKAQLEAKVAQAEGKLPKGGQDGG